MGDVVELPQKPKPPEGLKPGETWCHTKAVCLACKHEWEAVTTIPTIDLECPSCGVKRGVSKLAFSGPPGDAVYECACGNTYMEAYVTREGNQYLLCVGCGKQHKP